MIPGVLEIVSVGLVISACLAIFLDEAIYSVAALASTFILTSLLYALSGAVYVAIFQFAVGIGTLSILFLSGEMLSEKPLTKTKPSTTIAVGVLGAVLSLPAIFFSISSPNNVTSTATLGDALWNFDAFDVVLQGLVILTVAVGIAIVLYERKKKNSQKRSGEQ
jgi:NADH:ubiquinone oxidoreductase subunit 6 (subunit J)